MELAEATRQYQATLTACRSARDQYSIGEEEWVGMHEELADAETTMILAWLEQVAR